MKEKNRDDALYDELFGDIPNDQVGRIAYILGKRATNEKLNKDITDTAKKIKKLKSKKIEFTMWRIIKPSARPRVTTRSGYISMYVPHASEYEKWFESFAKEQNLPYIDTPCEIKIKHYEKTPTAFNAKQKVLCELGLLRPERRTGDVDNITKSILDMIQPTVLRDDCLVISSTQDLYYSIKPRCEVEITYMEKSPFDLL